MAKYYDPETGALQKIDGSEGEEAGDYLNGEDITHANSVFIAQIKGALEAAGIGVRSGGVVTAGSGLSVNISPLVGTAFSTIYGPVALRTKVSVNRAALPASSTFYLYAAIDTTAGPGNETRESRLPAFLTDAMPTMDGALLLAQVTTSGSAVTSVVDMRPVLDATHVRNQGNGTWSNATAYARNDIVLRNGIRYLAIQAGTNQDPLTQPTYWELLSPGGANTATLTTKGDTYVATGPGVVVRQPAGANNTVLMADSAQTNGIKYATITTDNIATGGQISKEILEYIAVSDIANNLAAAAGTWVDVVPNQTFTIERADNRQVNTFPSGCIFITTTAVGGGRWAARLVFDSATTATPLGVGGGFVPQNQSCNILQGTGSPRITGLGSGSHTVKLQVKCEVAATVNCRASTVPDYENFKLRIVEAKR